MEVYDTSTDGTGPIDDVEYNPGDDNIGPGILLNFRSEEDE